MKKRKIEISSSSSGNWLFNCSRYFSHEIDHEDKKEITKIVMNNRFINSDNIKMLSLNIVNCGNLTKIDLSENSIGAHGVEILISSILKSRIPLRILNLSKNFIEDYHSAKLDSLIKECHSLTELNLSCTRPKSAGVKMFLAALVLNTTLKKIDLSKNTIGNGFVPLLCELFEKNETLRIVNLDDTKLDVKAISKIADKINANILLSRVSISGPKIHNFVSIHLKNTFSKRNEEKKKCILMLCLFREFCNYSFIHSDYFPLDTLKLIINFIE